jgi:quercetin dioxygenase-like cupin family protein
MTAPHKPSLLKNEQSNMEKSQVYVPDLNTPPLEAPKDSIVSKIILTNDFLEVTLFAFDAGQGLSEHTSAFPAIIEILSGEGSMILGKKEVQLFQGTWIYMEPKLPHSLKAATPLKMLLTLRK